MGTVGGFFKALAGLMVRPSIGILEAGSKLLQGAGLAFMGKRGIQVGGEGSEGGPYFSRAGGKGEVVSLCKQGLYLALLPLPRLLLPREKSSAV